ncbi:MAG: nucleotidyltransferase family protein [Gammaproteobacteria bacterium]|nr:nucleotidyltransferase family protein [Gammaproteobacteria bacterium]
MKAMILAAGRGDRMRPLTDHTPKPLLQAGPHRLIEYHLLHLANAGFKEVVINVAWLGQQIIDTLGDGSSYGLSIQYSNEGEQALETGGGIVNALPLLGDDPFLVINADIWTDYPFASLKDKTLSGLAHLILIPNPEHNLQGDFYIQDDLLALAGTNSYTFSGMAIYHRDFFKQQSAVAFPLAPLFREFARQGRISAELYKGQWMDIGNQERLQALIKQQAR